MDKEKIIQLIERELVQADESSSQHEFEKHMYAIHTITSLYTISSTQSLQHNEFTHTDIDTQHKLMKTTNQQKSYDDVTPEEIQAMGGKVTHTNHSNKEQSSSSLSNSNLMTTDDEIGNGESIFDF